MHRDLLSAPDLYKSTVFSLATTSIESKERSLCIQHADLFDPCFSMISIFIRKLFNLFTLIWIAWHPDHDWCPRDFILIFKVVHTVLDCLAPQP